ncbi:MAG: VCBS repeat-containing protein, partial [Pseudodesulfovibrio sp.]
MHKKPFFLILAALITALLLAAPALAQETKKFAVLPFAYNGPQKYAYFPKAFQASLRSDLEWAGHVLPVNDEAVEGLGTPKSKADALNTLKNSGIDYLVSGVISILDKDATLTLNAYAEDGSVWTRTSKMGIDEITPWLDEQSKAIMGDVFHRPGYSTTEKEAKKAEAAGGPVAAPINSSFMPADDQYQAASLNPQFRYEGGTEESGRWRSQTFRFFSTGMVVGDADGDGKNEVFLLHSTGIAAFRYEEGKLKQIDNMELTPNTKYIRLELVDVDKDGLPELVVGSYQSYQRDLTKAPEGWPRSHILSFKDDKFKFLLKDYNQFLGVLRLPPTYSPILVTQRRGRRHIFDKRINEAFLKGGEIVEGQAIQAPEFGNIYNMVYLPDGMGYKYVVLDDSHRLK